MDRGWTSEDTFSCFVPAQMVICKGGEKGADKTGKRWIQGIASTDAKDLQGEIIDQHGIDLAYFLKHGFFNDDHKPGPEHKVGQPTEAKITKNGLWVKGFLFKNNKSADHYWELMNSLEASGSDRKVGFSIQGKVLRRNGTKIEKCWIQDIAITTQPVNVTTWAEIAKSLSTQKWDLVKEDDTDVEKAKEEEKKAADKALSAQSAMSVESLDADKKDVAKKSLLTFSEACSLVKSKTGLDDEAVSAVVNVAFSLFGQE